MWCEFFEPGPNGLVIQKPHEAGEGPLYFFWPLPDGHALRVPVCERHAAWLKEHLP